MRIIHIVQDNKFFDPVISHFEKDIRLENKYALIVNKLKYQFKYIKSVDKVKLLWNMNMVRNFLESECYDTIFFHSIPESLYRIFKYIPKDKIIIWWAWGYDIYLSMYEVEPLVYVNLYKECTAHILKKIKGGMQNKIKRVVKICFLRKHYRVLREHILKRINYFQPVIPIDYELMFQNNAFHAKEFYYPESLVTVHMVESDIVDRCSQGDILVGNSASYTNNHFDVWEYIRKQEPKGRRIIFPINYGDSQYANFLKTSIKSKKNELVFLDAFMPSTEYFSLLNRCSYAFFGVMRQQAMGNIFYCLKNGIKVFLF